MLPTDLQQKDISVMQVSMPACFNPHVLELWTTGWSHVLMTQHC